MKNNNEQLQKIKMCIQTYFNLYGTKPTIKEMTEWLGISYLPLLSRFMPEPSAA